MTLDEILVSLFPAGHELELGPHGTMRGVGRRAEGVDVALVGVVDGTPVGVDAALWLAGRVLDVIEGRPASPILMLVDSASQNMTRRDELLGLNEYLAHLIKTLALAVSKGHRTVALLYGPAAAGAFIATSLSTEILAAIPGAQPSVMDLPSIARVTKLPIENLTELSKSTPIFAPGLEFLFATGAVSERWNIDIPLADQLARALSEAAPERDLRDEIGLERKGRLEALGIARRVVAEAAHA